MSKIKCPVCCKKFKGKNGRFVKYEHKGCHCEESAIAVCQVCSDTMLDHNFETVVEFIHMVHIVQTWAQTKKVKLT